MTEADEPEEADAAAHTAGAQSVRRALAVLRIVAAGQDRGMRLTDIAGHAGLSRPTAHRILRVLVEEGAVEQDMATRRYLIGGEVSLLGLARSARFPLRRIAEPHLRQLAAELGDTAFLTIRNGVDSVCIDRHPGSFPIKVLSIEVGARRPLGAGVSGLVLLASLDDGEIESIVRRNARRLRALGVDARALVAQAHVTRELGHAYAPVGVMQGSRAVAVPVRLEDGRTVAGLAIATITERLPDARVPTVVARMQAVADLIGRQAGALPAKD